MNKIYFITAILLCLTGFQKANAQAVMLANPDNLFVQPNNPGVDVSYLDVLANDYYGDDCLRSEITISIKAGFEPTKGLAFFDNNSKTIAYLPIVNSGTDSLTYIIQCPSGNTSESIAYIHINNKPEVVSEIDCYVAPEGISFEIAEISYSPDDVTVNSLSNVLCGDIDSDGNVEMMAYNGDNSKIAVFRIVNGEMVNITNYDINLPVPQSPLPYANFSIANVNGNKYASVFILTYCYIPLPLTDPPLTTPDPAKLYKYSYDEDLEQYVEEWSVSVTYNYYYGNIIPYITDIMGDGNQQVCVIDKVYDAKDGTLLVESGYVDHTQNILSPYAFGIGAHNPLSGRRIHIATSLIAGDIDNDGIQEIIGGSCIYKVNLTNYSGTVGNTFELYRRANYTEDLSSIRDNTRPDIYDGHTALADIDLDGELEIIVTSKEKNSLPYVTPQSENINYLYVYNPRTGELLNSNIIEIVAIQANGPSRPFVGDIDGDGYPEIALTSYRYLGAFKFDFATNEIYEMWNLPTSDSSASTTLSIFDFAQDGKGKLVYRDETTLRIIDGREYDDNGDLIETGDPNNNDPTAGTRVLATFSGISSGTINEYPIIADVNNDNAAEIIVAGSNKLHVYGAAGQSKWAPARPVWNQFAYNPVYVNDDLTIPARPLNPATKFVSRKADGTIQTTHPFNNYLQQATLLNKEGTMITEGPDLTFSARAPKKLINNDDGSITINVVLINVGGASFTGPIEVQLYSSFGTNPVVYTKVGDPFSVIVSNPLGLLPNVELPVSYTIPAADAPADGTYDGFAITVNLKTDPGNNMPEYIDNTDECHEGYNNRALGFNVIDGEAVICQGGGATVYANPANTYDIDWYTVDGTKVASKSDSYYLPNKNEDVITYLLVQAFKKGTNDPVSPLRDTIYVYRAPDSLIWNNNAGNGDWNDARNWTNPADLTNANPRANIPRPCTNINLPPNINFYPDLSATSITTMYDKASCDSVYFYFGAEVKRPDLLSYNKAFVKVSFETHRWYMFAPPLKNFYAGDFFRKNVIPVKDDIKAYTKLWGAPHPFGGYYESDWTPLFWQPEITFDKGQGIGLWVSDNLDRDNIFHEFGFPKSNTQYNVYFENTETVNPYYPTKTVDRTSNHRFIFDNDGTNGTDFNLTTEAKETGSLVMVANPFMAHLDFDQFFTKNSSKIKNEYRVLNRNNNDFLYYKQGFPGSSDLTKDIAPMQAFIVEAKIPFSSLTINGTMTSVVPGETLKTAEDNAETKYLFLPLTAIQEGSRSKTYIGIGENFNNNYIDDEDVIGMFAQKDATTKPVSIYSLSNDMKKLNLNNMQKDILEKGAIIPLGIRTPSTQDITINVGNLSQIPEYTKAFIYDALYDTDYDLGIQSMYTFDNIKLDDNLFLDNRFFIKFVNTDTSIENNDSEETSDNSVIISCKNNYLNVISLNIIERITIYNIQGQAIHDSEPKAYSFKKNMNDENFFIVKIKTNKNTLTRKVINYK